MYNLRDMEVESKGNEAIVSGYGATVYRIWRYTIRDIEVESPGYRGIVSGTWSNSLRDMEV
jgi:hypothetical protein